MVSLSKDVVLARLGTEKSTEVPSGLLLQLNTPVAAFVGPAIWLWLTGDETASQGLPADSRAACVRAWSQAGLIRDDESDNPAVASEKRSGDLAAEAKALADKLASSLLVIGVSATCQFCAQLEADLTANRKVLQDARFGVLFAGHENIRTFGSVDETVVSSSARLAEQAALWGTPSGVMLSPGSAPVTVAGFSQVSQALAQLSGWHRDVIVEAPTSCSVNVIANGDTAVYPVTAGDRVIGVGLRGYATADLAPYVAERCAGNGYTPLVLLVERSKNLFLVFRGGEIIGRLKKVREVESLLDTVLAGYTATAPSSAAGPDIPVLCGALRTEDSGSGEVLLFPRSWMTDLVRQQSRLRRTGWTVCPDPYISLVCSPSGLSANVHFPASGSSDLWPARTEPVREILVDPAQAAKGAAASAAYLRAQVVNWAVRPVAASQVQSLAAGLIQVPVRATSCRELIEELTSFRSKGGVHTVGKRPG